MKVTIVHRMFDDFDPVLVYIATSKESLDEFFSSKYPMEMEGDRVVECENDNHWHVTIHDPDKRISPVEWSWDSVIEFAEFQTSEFETDTFE